MSHQPRKRFGQNFLRDNRVTHAIVSLIAPRPGEHIVEIGPGQGALTRQLLPECSQLDVLELDRDLVAYLRKELVDQPHLTIHAGDALKFDFSSLSQGEGLRIIGNLPYNISTPLLFHLFEQQVCIQDMHFMLQKEVVDRLCAGPGDEHYGRLSIMAQYYCEIESLMDVYPESFYPPPQVISSVVRLIPHATPPVQAATESLGLVVVKAFSMRRKTLRNSLKELFNEEEMREENIDPSARAETLALQDYARLANRYDAKRRCPPNNQLSDK